MFFADLTGPLYYVPHHKYDDGHDNLSQFANLAVAREVENGDVQQHSPDSSSSSRINAKLPHMYTAGPINGFYNHAGHRNSTSDYGEAIVSPGQSEDNPSSSADHGTHPILGAAFSFDPSCLGRTMMGSSQYFVSRSDPAFTAQFTQNPVR